MVDPINHDGVTDTVFLLSDDEVNAYIGNTDDQRMRWVLDMWGVAEGENKADENGDLNCWTRTPDPSNPSSVHLVCGDGPFISGPAYYPDGGVLPALNLKSDIYKSGKRYCGRSICGNGELAQ